MEITELKCAMLSYILKNGRRVQDAEPVYINHIAIPSITMLRFAEYLGAPLNRSKVVKLKHSEQLIEEISWKLKQLNESPLRINQKNDAIRRFIIPAFDYSFITSNLKKNKLNQINTLIRNTIRETINAKSIPISFFHTNWKDGGASIPYLRERQQSIQIRTYVHNRFFADKHTKEIMKEFGSSEITFRGIQLTEEQDLFFNIPFEDGKIVERRPGSDSYIAIKSY